jgi:isopenicillin N synthase-like dioxygenase
MSSGLEELDQMSFELEFLSLMSQHCCKLLKYVVVDFLWYRENDGTASTTRGNDFVDKYGRPQPDPQRWPSSRNGEGFKHVADKVHNMGLKFGIHVMRGISLAAVDKNTHPQCQGPSSLSSLFSFPAHDTWLHS